MERLKKYNQWLLSIIGTLVLIFVLIGGISMTLILLNDLRRDDTYANVGMLSDQSVEVLIQDSLRQQQISFDRISLIDTLKRIHLIPVGHANLNKPEKLNNDLLGLVNVYSDGEYYYYNGNSYNNLLIYHENDGSVQKIFDERLCINSYEAIETKEGILLKINVTREDTNADGYIDDTDLAELMLYDLTSNRLIKVEADGKHFLNFYRLYSSGTFIAVYGIDKDKNGVYDPGTDPRYLYVVDTQTGEIDLLVDEDLLNDLQGIFDGSK